MLKKVSHLIGIILIVIIVLTRDHCMAHYTLLFELVVITFSTSRHPLGIKITDIKTVSPELPTLMLCAAPWASAWSHTAHLKQTRW